MYDVECVHIIVRKIQYEDGNKKSNHQIAFFMRSILHQKCMILGLSKSLCTRFRTLKMSQYDELSSSATFEVIKVKTYGRNSIYGSSLRNYLAAFRVIPLVYWFIFSYWPNNSSSNICNFLAQDFCNVCVGSQTLKPLDLIHKMRLTIRLLFIYFAAV